MFGYIRISKLDLTFRDYNTYKSYYCGVCKGIKKNFGEVMRLGLNYDIVFMAIVLSALYENKEEYLLSSCILHPFHKKKIITNKYIDYCTSINVLLVYYKMMDDYLDNKSFLALMGSKIFKNSYSKVVETYPDKTKVICEGIAKIETMERSLNSSLNELSEEFGLILGELFAINDDSDVNSSLLRKLGYNLGKYIYILDCYDDFPEDVKEKQFNPLIGWDKSKVQDKVRDILSEIISELESVISTMEFKHSKRIIDNIIKLGLRNKMNEVFDRRSS